MISTEFNCVRTESANVYFRVRFKVDDLTRLVESQRSQVSGRSVQKYMVISHMDGVGPFSKRTVIRFKLNEPDYDI